MTEDALTQNSSSEFMVIFDNERTKENCYTESLKNWLIRKLGIQINSTWYTLTDISLAEEAVLKSL